MRSGRSIIVFALISILGIAAAIAPTAAQTPSSAQPTAPGLEMNAVFRAWRSEPSVQRCGICHYSPRNAFATRATDFCRLDELQQWLSHDKHAMARQRIEPIAPDRRSQAMERIGAMLNASDNADMAVPDNWIGESNFLSFAMCQKLGYDVESEDGYAEFRKNCLTCHGGYSPKRNAQAFARDNVSHPGIGCAYCHQLGTDERWIDEHSSFQAKTTWRNLPPDAKAEKGMRDLVSTDAQSQLCFSCHVGDLQQNMFVTHRMYAAGHPPLPSVELSTLVEAMPRHWRRPDELYQSLKEDPQRDSYFALNMPALAERSGGEPPIDQLPWQTDAIITGALASQQQALRLLSRAAAPDSLPSDRQHWGDYALYDCAACHHELRLPSTRQAARRSGVPGRPRAPEWPQALAHAVEQASGEDQHLASLQNRFQQAMTQRPFGDRNAVSQAAAELDRALEQVKKRAAAQGLNVDFSRNMLVALAQTPDDLLVDYHAARQVNWAIRSIDCELARLGKPLPADVRATIAKLGTGDATASVYVSADLPSGLDKAIYPEFVKEELDRQAGYHSEQFSKQLKALAEALGR